MRWQSNFQIRKLEKFWFVGIVAFFFLFFKLELILSSIDGTYIYIENRREGGEEEEKVDHNLFFTDYSGIERERVRENSRNSSIRSW